MSQELLGFATNNSRLKGMHDFRLFVYQSIQPLCCIFHPISGLLDWLNYWLWLTQQCLCVIPPVLRDVILLTTPACTQQHSLPSFNYSFLGGERNLLCRLTFFLPEG